MMATETSSTQNSTGYRPRCQPKQSRGIETRNTILDAGAALFAEQGFEETTTHQISSRAGVSVGTLYRYFEDKEAIIKELYTRDIADRRRRILKAVGSLGSNGHDIRQMVRQAIAQAFAVYAKRPRLRRVLAEQSRRIDELAEVRRSHEAEAHHAVRQLLATSSTVRASDLDLAAYLIILFIESLIDDHILYRRDQMGFDDHHVIEAATNFIVGYTRGQPS